MAATEVPDGNCPNSFVAVEEGPASRSYGLQVARLAGVPAPVIRAAERRLALLEEAARNASPQRDLFDAARPQPDGPRDAVAQMPESVQRLVDELAALEPDHLAPRDALDVVYRLQLAARALR